jgi:NAD(P)-dependent dehydrogenase (short-subunit alcohol dehydrogenase family)
MISDGWTVFAGIRKPQDGENLRREFGAAVVPLVLDLEQHESITAATRELESILEMPGLDGLVNVAGIGMIRPLEYASTSDVEKIFEVNVFGQLAIIQAFLPFIRKRRGRIVNISSVGAHIAIPFGGLLNASKAAFGLMSDALRLELHPFGISVCTVEPGSIKTPAVDKTLGDVEGILRQLPPQGIQRYGALLKEFAKRAYQRETNGSSPAPVASAVHHALTNRRPRTRYVVGKDARLLTALPRFVPDRVLDRIRFRLFGIPGGVNTVSEGVY